MSLAHVKEEREESTGTLELPPGVVLHAPRVEADKELLTPGALAFLPPQNPVYLTRVDGHAAWVNQKALDAGWLPGFLDETAEIRAGNWTVAPIPEDLRDRRVEITGPVDRKMVINALNSGASVFMADFEDSCSPT
jgi:malate synthase